MLFEDLLFDDLEPLLLLHPFLLFDDLLPLLLGEGLDGLDGPEGLEAGVGATGLEGAVGSTGIGTGDGLGDRLETTGKGTEETSSFAWLGVRMSVHGQVRQKVLAICRMQ